MPPAAVLTSPSKVLRAELKQLFRAGFPLTDATVWGQAARTLFGSARGMCGTTLTTRRLEAAQILECYETTYASTSSRSCSTRSPLPSTKENLRYKSVADQARPPIGTHEDTLVATEDSYTEQEELLCQVWSAVYGYRAVLIATERRLREARTEEREPDPDLKEHLDTGTWQLARLLSFVSDYLDRYGEEILHGETPSMSKAWLPWPAQMTAVAF